MIRAFISFILGLWSWLLGRRQAQQEARIRAPVEEALKETEASGDALRHQEELDQDAIVRLVDSRRRRDFESQ